MSGGSHKLQKKVSPRTTKKHVSEAALDEDREKKLKSKKTVLLSHSTCTGVHRVHFRHYHPKKKKPELKMHTAMFAYIHLGLVCLLSFSYGNNGAVSL